MFWTWALTEVRSQQRSQKRNSRRQDQATHRWKVSWPKVGCTNIKGIEKGLKLKRHELRRTDKYPWWLFKTPFLRNKWKYIWIANTYFYRPQVDRISELLAATSTFFCYYFHFYIWDYWVWTLNRSRVQARKLETCCLYLLVIATGSLAPVLLPGKSHGRRSLVSCSPWGR